MVTLSVRCSDQSASDCLKTVEVEIGVPELTAAQLASIFTAAPMRQPTPLPGTSTIAPDTTYFVPVTLDATVCEACTKDRSSEIPEFR